MSNEEESLGVCYAFLFIFSLIMFILSGIIGTYTDLEVLTGTLIFIGGFALILIPCISFGNDMDV